ncbi:MAG: response regulator transcription factor [Deltaproteobacteria bacterium]
MYESTYRTYIKNQITVIVLAVSCNITFKILLVEDNLTFRRVLKQSLHEFFPCMIIAEAGDGEEGLRKIDTLLPNLIFMDINLPGENGLELTRKIKTTHPETPIIILTNYDLPECRQLAYEYGANSFLVKGSSTLEELITEVESLRSASDVRS